MNIQKPIIKSFFILIISISSFAQSSKGFTAKFYRWTDENGGIHYSDKPDANNTAEPVDIYAPKPSSSTPTNSKNEEESSNEEVASENEDKKPQQANSIEEYCKKLASNIKTLETKGNISSIDTEGKKTSLSKEEQQKVLENSKQEYASRCNAQ